jgi:RNA polymerase sigma-70 factor (ECF subfamily)
VGEDEGELLRRLRAGDEVAFAALVERYHAPLIRVALTFVPSRAVAEEVVQDTWLGVLRGVDRFEGRSSLQTWLYRILVNRARTTGVREHRSLPLADTEPAVDPARFAPDGTWASPPEHWSDEVDERLSAPALAARIRMLVEELPAGPRQVVTLRDVEGLSSAEVCEVLGITEGNQRVLLHRGRSRVRAVLEQEMQRWEGGERATPA